MLFEYCKSSNYRHSEDQKGVACRSNRSMCVGHHELCINGCAWRKCLCPHASGTSMTPHAIFVEENSYSEDLWCRSRLLLLTLLVQGFPAYKPNYLKRYLSDFLTSRPDSYRTSSLKKYTSSPNPAQYPQTDLLQVPGAG
jgi:hypothetical protein